MKTCADPLSPQEQIVWDALSKVIDPEIGENIVDLGLVYGFEIDGSIVKVELTMTSPACPMGEMLLDDIDARLTRALPEEMTFHIHLVWDPPWEPGKISAEAKQRLGWS